MLAEAFVWEGTNKHSQASVKQTRNECRQRPIPWSHRRYLNLHELRNQHFLACQNIYDGCEQRSGSSNQRGLRGGVVVGRGNGGVLINSFICQFCVESSDPLQDSFRN